MTAWFVIAAGLAWCASMGALYALIGLGALDRALDDLAAEERRRVSFWKNFHAASRGR